MIVLLTALATGVGALARFLVDRAITARRRGAFPLGTFVINVVGAFGFGWVTALAAHGRLGTDGLSLLGPGLAAGFTTFSTWTVETTAAWRADRRLTSVLNIALTLAVGVPLAALGLGLG